MWLASAGANVSLTPEAAQQALSQVLLPAVASNLTGGELSLNATLQIAAAVENAQRGVIRGLFGTLNSTQANQTQVVTVTTAVVSITVAAVPVSQDGKVTIGPESLPGVPLSQALPKEALQQAVGQLGNGSSQLGLSFCRYTGLNPFGPSKEGNTGEVVQAAGDIISLSVTDANGKLLAVNNLATPIVLVIPIALTNLTQDQIEEMLMDGAFPQCRWWNQTLRQWEGDGCKTMSLRNFGAELLCACTHLTDFGAFVSPDKNRGLLMGDLSGVFQFLWMVLAGCANVASLWTDEGIAALNAKYWMGRGSVSVIFTLMLLILLILLPAFAIDYSHKEELRHIWAQMEHVHWFDLKAVLFETWVLMRRPSLWKKNFVKNCITSIMAFDMGISQGTVDTIREAQRVAPGYQPEFQEALSRSYFSLSAGIVKAACRLDLLQETILQDYAFEGIPQRDRLSTPTRSLLLLRRAFYLYLRTFAADHPLMFLVQADLHILASQRVLLLSVQYLGSIFASAFWYQTSGKTLTSSSPEECVATTAEERVRKAIPVAIACTLIASCPTQILSYMVTSRPRGAGQVNGTRIDILLNVVFYILSLGLCTWFLFYLCTFLANVHESSADLWMQSALESLLCSLLVLPLLQALVNCGFTSFFLVREPTLALAIFENERSLRRSKGGEEVELGTGAAGHRVIRVGEASEIHRQVAGDDVVPFNSAGPDVSENLPNLVPLVPSSR